MYATLTPDDLASLRDLIVSALKGNVVDIALLAAGLAAVISVAITCLVFVLRGHGMRLSRIETVLAKHTVTLAEHGNALARIEAILSVDR